jgi:NAD(P)-dependent dehydrogenase (short-subunit alcohol dehydrogenase family)
MLKTLEGQKALVTGSGSGLGKAIAIALANAGADICVLDVSGEAAETTAKEISSQGNNAVSLRASVGDSDEVARAFQDLDKKWSGIDLLVNNAGINMNKPSLELNAADWRRAININLDGTFFCAQQAAMRMKKQSIGSIVNVSSIYGLVAAPNRAAYCASKAGIVMLTKSLAIEWAELGIRVNAVAPGYSHTPAISNLVAEGRFDLPTIANRIPQKRLAAPEEIADAVLYLCEKRSQHITGHVLAVDGGWTAYGYI